MRIYITGGNGQLALSVKDVFQDKNDMLFFASKNTLNILDKKTVEERISSFHPDIIFHFASMTRGDECAANPEQAYKVNVDGTRNIISAAHKTNAAVLFVSTNEVFDGRKKERYTDKDAPNPITVVGKNKLEAENLIKESLNNYFIIRTSWLYSNWSHNFLHAVLKKAVKNKKIELVKDEIGSPTYTFDLAEALKSLVKTKDYGTYHIVNEGEASRLVFAKKAFELSGLKDIEIIPVPLAKFNRLSKPPLFSALENTDIKHLGITMPNWEDALSRFLKKYDLLNSL